MATTFTNLSEAQLDDIVIPAIQSMLPYLNAFSTRTAYDQGLLLGSTYKVPIIGNLTRKNKTPGSPVDSTGSLTGVDVTVSKFPADSFDANEGEIPASLMATWWPEQMREACIDVAQQVVDDALALVTASNYGSGSGDVVTEALADFDIDTLGDIRAKARAKLQRMRGAFICGPDIASKLVTMQQIVLALAIADDRNSIADGKIPGGVLGYDAYEYTAFPDNDENLVAAVIGRGAIAIAAGAPDQLISTGEGDVAYRRVFEEPESGLRIQYTETVHGAGKRKAEVAILEGVAKGQDAVVRLVTA
jgi:hypothetical protein